MKRDRLNRETSNRSRFRGDVTKLALRASFKGATTKPALGACYIDVAFRNSALLESHCATTVNDARVNRARSLKV